MYAADFLLLMCASLQWTVFENEKKEEWMVMGGENKDNPDPMEDMLFNPAPNFINCRYGLVTEKWLQASMIIEIKMRNELAKWIPSVPVLFGENRKLK